MDFSPLTNDQLVALIKGALAECSKRGAATVAAAQKVMVSASEAATIAQDAAAKTAAQLADAERQRIVNEATAQVRQAGVTLTAAERAQIASDAERKAVDALTAETRRQEQIRAAAKVAQTVKSPAALALEESAAAETKRQENSWACRKRLGRMVQQTLGTGYTLNVWTRSNGATERRIYIENHGGKIQYNITGNKYDAPKSLLGCPKALRAEVLAICEHAATEWTTLPTFDCDQAARAQVKDLALPDAWIRARDARVDALKAAAISGAPEALAEVDRLTRYIAHTEDYLTGKITSKQRRVMSESLATAKSKLASARQIVEAANV